MKSEEEIAEPPMEEEDALEEK